MKKVNLKKIKEIQLEKIHNIKIKKPTTRSIGKLIYSGIVLVLVAAIMLFFVKFLGTDKIQSFIEKSGPLAPLIFVLVCALTLPITPLSSGSLYMASAVMFKNNFYAYTLSFVAAMIGCSLNFWISRKLGRDAVERLIGKEDLYTLDNYVEKLNKKGRFFIFLAVAAAADVFSYAVGLTSIKYKNYLLPLFLGNLILVAMYVFGADVIFNFIF